MESVFLHLVNMSITAGWLVLAVLALRLVFHRAPRWIHCVLWVLVAVRLILPISIESDLSLVPGTEPVPVAAVLENETASETTAPPVQNSTTVGVDAPSGDASNGMLVQPPKESVTDTDPAPAPEAEQTAVPTSTTAKITLVEVLTWVWLGGIVALLLYAALATVRLYRRVDEAVRLCGNVWQCDTIDEPFILGIIRPRVYLPSTLAQRDRPSVLAHEQAHLKRHDHWWKPLGFLVLAVYWFNPLMWVAYVFLCRDIEAACDERVIRGMSTEQRKDYSTSLLVCSAPRHLISACPLAFGETAVKSRIKGILHYKKPAFWVILVAVIASVAVAVCLLTNPKTTVTEEKTEKEPVTDPVTEETFRTAYAKFTALSMNWMDEEPLDDSNLPVTVIRSVQELNAFIELYDEKMYGAITSGSTGKMPEVYQEEYFQNNAVLAVYYKEGSSSVEPKVIGVRSGDTLQVLVDVHEPYMQNCALGQWFMMVEVSLEELNKATSVSAQVRGHVAVDQYVAAFDQATKTPSEAKELWRERLNAEEDEYLRRMIQEQLWGDRGLKADACTFIGAINFNGVTYYVSSDYSLLCTEKEMAYLNDENETFLRQLYLPRSAVTNVPPYHKQAFSDAQVTVQQQPEKNYWQTFSHPLPYTEALQVTGGYSLSKYDVEKLQRILDEIEWKIGPEQDAEFLSDAYFCLDGETRYYVYVDTVAGYSYLALDQEKHAPLTEEQENVIEGLVSGGVTAKATHYLSGYFAEWNKAERYFVLDVVWADDKSLVGRKIRVNTKNTLGRGLPYIGTLLETAYDGAIVQGDMVYAISWQEQDESSLSSKVDANVSGTFTGKVIHVADGAVLMNCYDKSQFDTVWVYYQDAYSDRKPQMNEEYQVVFDGQIMGTYPIQVIAEEMLQVSSTPLESEFIREERAVEIAVAYWNIQLGVKDLETGYYTTVYVMENPTEEHPLYKVGSRRVAEKDGAPGNSALFNVIYIDAVTGAIVEDIPDQE